MASFHRGVARRARRRVAPGMIAALALAGAGGGCASFAGSRALGAPQTNTGVERYASWFGDSDGRVLYFGLSPFWESAAQCEAEGGEDCALRDLDQPGDHLIGRFELARGRFLPPLLVRPRDEEARSSVWDVLVHSNGRIYYTTFWDEFGSVLPDGTDVRHYAGAGVGLNELWEGPDGEIYVTRYLGSVSGDPDENGAVVVFGPDGERRREFPFKREGGALISPKSIAVDRNSGDIWINSDIFYPDGSSGHDTFRLDPNGVVRERFAEPLIDFISFDSAGRGWFVENSGERSALRIEVPQGPATCLDLGPHGQVDYVQDIKHAGDLTLLATWGLRVHVVRASPGGEFELTTFPPEVPGHCPPGPILGYTAAVGPDGDVYETVTCGVTVLHLGRVPPSWRPRTK